MKNVLKQMITCILVCALILTGSVSPTQAATSYPSETNPFGDNVYAGKTNQKKPFFTSVLPDIEKNIKANNRHSISPYYDSLPKATNPNNFQGLGTSTYANINGKTVTAEGFHRIDSDSLHDPNAGMGLLIYQCIQYKLAHPKEDVDITFSYYRTSATAAVCVIPDSKYYGYMRSLYTKNYDEHGFVRISYMLTEAARMGIDVTIVGQLPSYGVKQYNPSTKKLKTRKALNFKTYFNEALKTDCYNSFAKGKKVSDYMDFVAVKWDNPSVNMQHVKSCTVSHYLASDGKEHRYGVFFTTANLDENDYLGRNGNQRSQTGVIITNHEPLYRVTKNYTNLMKKYSYKDGIDEFRSVVKSRNEEQAELINNGKESSISKSKQIVYLGTKNDKVFKLCFTPVVGKEDSWDTKNNIICTYLDKLTKSNGYIELAWKEFAFEKNNLSSAIADKIEDAFTNKKNAKNVLFIRVSDIDLSRIDKLKKGKDIKAYSISNGKKDHCKDFFMSYVEGKTRHNVSILTSCNMAKVGFHYRTNSILVIDETSKTGGDFYAMMTPKFSDGYIKRDDHTHSTITCLTPATLKEKGKRTKKCLSCGEKTATTKIYSKIETVKLTKKAYTYDGKKKTPSVKVITAKGTVLEKNKDYTVSYGSGRKLPGKYKVKVTFKGNYEGSKTLTLTIRPNTPTLTSVKSTSKGKVTAKWKNVSNETGYQLYYSTSKDKGFKKVKSYGADVLKGSKTELKRGKTYYFKVRAYTKSKNGTAYGLWSEVKKVKVK